MKRLAAVLLAGCFALAGATNTVSQERKYKDHDDPDNQNREVQIIALDECDPGTFNVVPILKPDFCHSVALDSATTFDDLITNAGKGNPDPGWDFEPDDVKVKQGAQLSVVNQGGEPHTFTEVKEFGGGFIDGLNGPGETVVPECAGGFKNLAVARTRIVQGSTVKVAGLSKGKHHFQCCIHPWMRVTVDVK